MRVTGECVTTGQRRTMDFFLVNRVEVREEPTTSEDSGPAAEGCGVTLTGNMHSIDTDNAQR